MLNRADIASGQPNWLVLLPLLAAVPGACVLGLAVVTRRLMRRGDQVEAATRTANEESMRLLANMSHELRTPLTGILGQADMMAAEGDLTNSQTERLTLLTEAATLMRNVVNRVIDVARPDGRDEAPVLEPCDLDHLIQTCLGMVEGEARRKGLRLTSISTGCAEATDARARPGSAGVWPNLLMNACQIHLRGNRFGARGR